MQIQNSKSENPDESKCYENFVQINYVTAWNNNIYQNTTNNSNIIFTPYHPGIENIRKQILGSLSTTPNSDDF